MTSKQLIPFPLPEYLRQFVISQMDSPIEILDDGSKVKALHITRSSTFGKFILRSLSKSNKPAFVKSGITMHISISDHSGNNDKNIPAGKYSYLDLEEREIKEIISVFKAWFQGCLFHFIEGGRYYMEKDGKQRGIVHDAILAFMDKYSISHEDSHFEAFRKYYSREKKSQRAALERVI